MESGAYFLCLVLVTACLCLVSNAEDKCLEITIFTLKTANCDAKNLKTIPDDLDSLTQVLRFSENHLTYLQMDEFKRYTSLQQIHLVRNRIETIAPDAFRGLNNLHILDLEGNLLSEVPKAIFQHLHSLRILVLKSNQVQWIASDTFRDVPNLEELNFENCWLERIDPYAFRGLSKLIEINLVNNELTSLRAEMATVLPRTLQIFRLYRNPWTCDCRLRWLRVWLNESKVNWHFAKNTPACTAPPLLSTIKWYDMRPDQFACPAQIVANSSTSQQLLVGGNATIECVVSGDPPPKIMWKKDGKFISKDNVKERNYVSENGETHIRSALHINDATRKDDGDYKCITENSAGRSEQTYKLWVKEAGPEGTMTYVTMGGMSSGAMIGIGTGALIIVLLIIVLVVCIFKKSNNTHRPYVGREYKKANHTKPDTEKDKAMYQVEIPDETTKIKEKGGISPTINVAHTQLLLAKEVHNDTEDTEGEKENGRSLNHISEPKSTEFKMRIFTSYNDDDKEQADLPTSPDREGGKVEGLSVDCNHIREATPDLLCDDKHSRSNHKTPTPPPPPAAYFVNHIASVQKRAEENPYAKPSELKSGGQKTPDSSQSLQDYTHDLEKSVSNKSKDPSGGPKSVILSPKATNKEPVSKESRHSKDTSPCSSVPKDSTCTNPVCMKAHTRSKSHAEPPMSPRAQTSSPSKTHISNSHSVGSMSDLDCSDSSDKKSGRSSKGEGARHHQALDSDRYKTLPCRGSQAGRGSPGRKLPVTPTQSSKTSSPTGPHAMYTEKSAASIKPRVQFASPVRESPSSSLSSTPTSPRLLPQGGTRHLPIGQSATLGRPLGNPIHPKGLKVMSPEGPRTLTFPGAIETLPTPAPLAPPGSSKPTRTYGCSTSIDDLLSPPFAHLNTETSKAGTVAKRQGVNVLQPGQPKPGHKDEYGTAV